MESALSDIEFLALSANRVEVLTLLAEGRHTRDDLQAETGASQATLGRILADFEERCWARRDGSEFLATATGELVASGFRDLLEILETERDLRGIVRYLPTHAMDFDLGSLADATITTPSGTRPNAPVQRVLDLLEEGREVRVFSHAFNEQSLSVIERRVAAGEQTLSGVFSQSAIQALSESPDLRRALQSLLESDTVSIRVRADGVPLAVTVVDDTVHLLLRDENGVLQASIDTDEEAVRSWATDSFDHYWRTAKPLESTDLDG